MIYLINRVVPYLSIMPVDYNFKPSQSTKKKNPKKNKKSCSIKSLNKTEIKIAVKA